jgi:hypothetical protein
MGWLRTHRVWVAWRVPREGLVDQRVILNHGVSDRHFRSGIIPHTYRDLNLTRTLLTPILTTTGIAMLVNGTQLATNRMLG